MDSVYAIWFDNWSDDDELRVEYMLVPLYSSKEKALEALKSYADKIDRDWLMNPMMQIPSFFKDYTVQVCEEQMNVTVEIIVGHNEFLDKDIRFNIVPYTAIKYPVR